MPSGRTLLVGTIIFIVVGILLVIFLPRLLLENWIPASDAADRDRLTGTAAQLVLFGLGGVIGAVGVALSLSRHGQELDRAEREREDATRRDRTLQLETDREIERRREFEDTRKTEQERSFRERFVGAVGLIAQDTNRTARTAGIGALASLADDWIEFGRPEEAQLCIEMICAHIRSKPPTDSAEKEQHVKRFAIEQIRQRLRPTAPGTMPMWVGFRIDLTGIYVDFELSLEHIHVSAPTVLRLAHARIGENGKVSLASLEASGGEIDLSDVTIENNGHLIVGNIFDEQPANLTGDTWIRLDGLTMADDAILWVWVTPKGTSLVSVQDTQFGGSSQAEFTVQISERGRFVGRFNGTDSSITGLQGGAQDQSSFNLLPSTLKDAATAHIGMGYEAGATSQIAPIDGPPGSFSISNKPEGE